MLRPKKIKTRSESKKELLSLQNSIDIAYNEEEKDRGLIDEKIAILYSEIEKLEEINKNRVALFHNYIGSIKEQIAKNRFPKVGIHIYRTPNSVFYYVNTNNGIYRVWVMRNGTIRIAKVRIVSAMKNSVVIRSWKEIRQCKAIAMETILPNSDNVNKKIGEIFSNVNQKIVEYLNS